MARHGVASRQSSSAPDSSSVPSSSVPTTWNVLVELHVDLAAVVEGDLDLVLAFLVVDLGLGDSAFTGLRECRLLGLLKV